VSRHRVLRKTKVVATLGPACDGYETIRAMIQAGMNVARMNFSHGTHEEHRVRLETLRRAAASLDANIAVMLDTRGLEIRTGSLAAGPALLETGQRFTLYGDERPGDARGVCVSTPDLAQHVSPGCPILIADGTLELRVVSVEGRDIHCEVVRGGRLDARKGVNLPETSFPRAALSPADCDDLAWAVEHDVDYIAASFVHDASDVIAIRKLIEGYGASIPIIAKIENTEGVRNLDEIVATANGAMVARGDLGVEIPLRQVPLVQKKIIRATVMNGKPVITATQMLDSMERNLRPTRAEVSDVANAILDGTSAVMLSGETAVGAHPVEAVRTMASIALETEASLRVYGHLQQTLASPAHVVTEAVSQASITMADHLQAAAIITLTETGYTSRSISKYRPDCPILAITPSRAVMRKLAMNWGVTALHFEGERSDEAMIAFAVRRARELGYVATGDVVVVTAGRARQSGSTDSIRVVTVA
jgi:pyruvate kinase